MELKVSSAFRAIGRARAPAPIPLTTEARLLMWVLAGPRRITQIDVGLLDPGLPEARFLTDMKRAAEGGEVGELTQAILIEKYGGSEHEPVLNRAQQAMLDFELEEETAESEILSCLLTLRIHRANEEFERLKRTVDLDPGDRTKQLALQSKLQELTEMKRMRQEGRFLQS
jgi:hypothetical protein